MKTFVLIMLAAIVASLFSGLFFLTQRDPQGSTRVLTALKVRVALSIVLVAFLVGAYFLGYIPTE